MCASFRVFSINFAPLAIFLRDNFNYSAGLVQWRSLAQTLHLSDMLCNLAYYGHLYGRTRLLVIRDLLDIKLRLSNYR